METKKRTIDVYQMITNRFTDQLKKGIIPWKRPWSEQGLPQNLVTGKQFRGVNLWLLAMLGFKRNLFLSFKQLKEIGGVAKEGEKSAPVVFWNWVEAKDEDSGETKLIPFLRYYTVYNIEQCENIPEGYIPAPPQIDLNPTNNCERIIADMPSKPAVKQKDKKAYYNPLLDVVNIPKRESFEADEDFFEEYFHQLIHSTGHLARLGRKEIIQMPEFGSEQFSYEELIAEMGICNLKSWCGFTKDASTENESQASGWLKKLERDKKLIISASMHAQKAVDYILNLKPEEQVEPVTSGESKDDLPF